MKKFLLKISILYLKYYKSYKVSRVTLTTNNVNKVFSLKACLLFLPSGNEKVYKISILSTTKIIAFLLDKLRGYFWYTNWLLFLLSKTKKSVQINLIKYNTLKYTFLIVLHCKMFLFTFSTSDNGTDNEHICN